MSYPAASRLYWGLLLVMLLLLGWMPHVPYRVADDVLFNGVLVCFVLELIVMRWYRPRLE